MMMIMMIIIMIVIIIMVMIIMMIMMIMIVIVLMMINLAMIIVYHRDTNCDKNESEDDNIQERADYTAMTSRPWHVTRMKQNRSLI